MEAEQGGIKGSAGAAGKSHLCRPPTGAFVAATATAAVGAALVAAAAGLVRAGVVVVMVVVADRQGWVVSRGGVVVSSCTVALREAAISHACAPRCNNARQQCSLRLIASPSSHCHTCGGGGGAGGGASALPAAPGAAARPQPSARRLWGGRCIRGRAVADGLTTKSRRSCICSRQHLQERRTCPLCPLLPSAAAPPPFVTPPAQPCTDAPLPLPPAGATLCPLPVGATLWPLPELLPLPLPLPASLVAIAAGPLPDGPSPLPSPLPPAVASAAAPRPPGCSSCSPPLSAVASIWDCTCWGLWAGPVAVPPTVVPAVAAAELANPGGRAP